MTPLLPRRRFTADRRTCFRTVQARQSAAAAVRWEDATEDALWALATSPSPAPGHQAPDLGPPYRQVVFGTGRKPAYRIVFAVTPAGIELAALRHLSQPDLAPRDL